MTTHQLARILLEMEDLPAVSLDDLGNYTNVSSVFPYEIDKSHAGYIMPEVSKKKNRTVPVVVIT